MIRSKEVVGIVFLYLVPHPRSLQPGTPKPLLMLERKAQGILRPYLLNTNVSPSSTIVRVFPLMVPVIAASPGKSNRMVDPVTE